MIEKRQRERPEALCTSFATYERHRGLTELRCRCCGAVTGKMAPVGQQRVRRVKNQTFVETDLQFTKLANYREVEVFMEDGSRHIGNCCVACAPRLSDPAYLARFTETDLAQWRAEGYKITARMDRRPVRLGRVSDFIQD